MSNYLLAQEVVARLSRRELAVALIKHKNVLFDDGTVLFKPRGSQHYDPLKYRGSSTSTTTSGPQHKSAAAAAQPARRQQNKSRTSFGQTQTASPLLGATQAAHGIVSFSDFTETILLATENTDLIEAISDVFIHALCIEHSITLEIILQLFLNYIASHIGHKGYQTSQKVFVNILQVSEL